jgi:hypothetical protein
VRCRSESGEHSLQSCRERDGGPSSELKLRELSKELSEYRASLSAVSASVTLFP